jgi:NADPH:quinone reductase-like Zn-dependent oxidoreductase
MKAIIFDHYGPPEDLTLQEVPPPVPRPTRCW